METNKELMRAEFEACKNWANPHGFDTAHTYDSERSKWIFLNPFTADIWKCWQARAALSQRSEAVPDVSWEDGFHNLLFALKVIAGAPSTCDDPAKAAQMFSTMPWVEALEALGIQQPAPAPSAAAGEQLLLCHPDITKRIRSIVDLLCLQSDMPEDDLTGYEWAVLGLVRSEIARLKAADQPTPAQGDAVPVEEQVVMPRPVRIQLDESEKTSVWLENRKKTEACDGGEWVRFWKCESHTYETGRLNEDKCKLIEAAIDATFAAMVQSATRQSSADAVDAARLDFMAQHEAWIAWTKDGESCRVFISNEDGENLPLMGWVPDAWAHDARTAIDKARAAIAAQGGKG